MMKLTISRILLAGSSIAVFLSIFGHQWVSAQVQGEWSLYHRLSTEQGKASDSAVASDGYGYVHTFWSEEVGDYRTLIQYARFDGKSWTSAVDLYITNPTIPINNVSAAVDPANNLHLIWTQGQNGPVFYIRAPSHDALSAQRWTKPKRVDIPASRVYLQVDSNGVLHVLYGRIATQDPGVYYVRSMDNGLTWTDSHKLDPDILPDYVPGSIGFMLDGEDGLHAVWYYVGLLEVGGDWPRYAHSLDGGRNWSAPLTIDRDRDGTGKLDFASPVMAVSGQSVHIVWAGGALNYRNHMYSEDRGRTWSRPERIFGNLNGQAFEGLTVDGMERIHYIGQIRYPMGIYHAYWDQGRWSTPSLIYLISRNSNDPIGDRIHAHHTHPIVRAGNQLVVTFADSPIEPFRNVYAMFRDLEGLPPSRLLATPIGTLNPTPVMSAGVTPTPAGPATDLEIDPAVPQAQSPAQALWIGVITPIVFVGGTILIWITLKSRN